MRNLLILTAVLLSSAASAQVTVQLRLSTGQDTVRFGPSDCADRPITATWTRSGNACDQLRLWLTANDCGDNPATGDVSLDSISVTTLQAQTTGGFQFNLNQLPFPATDGGGGCSALTEEKTFRLCGGTKTVASIYDASCSSSVTKANGMKFIYDGKAPNAPTINSANGLDKALVADVSEPDGASKIELVVSRDGAEVTRVEQIVGKGSIRVEGLVNEVTYQVVAFAIDEANNKSPASEPKEATPIKTNGFFEEYANANGKEMGCGATGGGVMGSAALLAVLGFWLSSRRNRS